MQIDKSPQAEQHRALHSLAELFPPQHVEVLNPVLLLYFPIGMALRPLPPHPPPHPPPPPTYVCGSLADL